MILTYKVSELHERTNCQNMVKQISLHGNILDKPINNRLIEFHDHSSHTSRDQAMNHLKTFCIIKTTTIACKSPR